MGEVGLVGMGLVARDGERANTLDAVGLLAGLDRHGAVAFFNRVGFGACGQRGAEIVLDLDLHVFLGVEVELLGILLVLEPYLVASSALLGRLGADHGLGLVGGQRDRRGMGAVVDATGDERLVRVAVDAADHHLLAHARQEQAAKSCTCRSLRHPHPTRAGVVLLAQAVPVELNLDAAVLVGPDLFAAGPDDHRRLTASHSGPRRDPGRAKRHRGRESFEVVEVDATARGVVDPAQHMAGVERGQEMP